jgi:hypothetical protein
VAATGNPAVRFQWRKNGQDILGAKQRVFTLSAVQPADDDALFSCTVSNTLGTVESYAAELTIRQARPTTTNAPGANVHGDFGQFKTLFNLMKDDSLIITLDLKDQRDVTVSIRTRKGEKIEELRNNGLSYVVWKPNKERIASGVYLLTLEMGSEVKVKRIVVVK